MANIFQKLEYEAFRAGITPRSRESMDWFRRKAQSMGRVNRRQLMNQDPIELRNRGVLGNMYMYFYDPKTKDTLPYYDSFPLTIVVGPAPGGFYGLNLHYIPPRDRAVLMDNLNQYASNNKYDQTTRLELSYRLLKRYGRAVPCVKRYLGDRIVSQTVRIDADEWEIAIFLPVERFQKASKGEVWADSRRFY